MTSTDSGRNLTAFVLIALGALFLAAQVFNFSIMGLLWPFFIILPGLAFLYPALTGDRSKAGLAIPGAMVTGTGLILLYQSLTNHWESWAYIWALYPVLLGFAFTFVGRRTEDMNLYKVGNGFVKWGLLSFVGMWLLFEGLLFGGSSILVNLLLPLVLIGAGGLLLFRRGAVTFGDSKKKKNSSYARSKGHNLNAAAVNPDLQRKIDAALAEEDEIEPHAYI